MRRRKVGERRTGKNMIGKEVGKGEEEVGDEEEGGPGSQHLPICFNHTGKWPIPYLLVIFSGQAYFQEQLYNSTLLGCSECYTQLIPLHLGHVT